MATKKTRQAAPVYSEDKLNKARAANNYIKLGPKRGSLLITGAPQKWKLNPNFVYVPQLRVAGEPQDVINGLVSVGYSEADARQAVNNGYTKAHENSAAFMAEVEAAKKHKAGGKGKATKKAAHNLAPGISWYAEQLDSATVETKAGGSPRRKSPKARKSRSKSPKARTTKTKSTKSKSKSPKARATKSKSPKAKGGKRAAKPLADKIAALSDGKVMDVSKLKSDGSGAKAIARPGPKSKKVLIPGHHVVSDHKNGVKAAAKLLGDESLVGKWESAKSGKPAHTPRSSPSPRTSPARALPVTSPVHLPSIPTVKSPRTSPGLAGLPRLPLIGSPR